VKSSIRTALLLTVLGAGTAIAAGKPYMTLVGELLGAVESPRLIRDFCATRSPSSAHENSRLYDAWKLRHADLLAAVADQVARANVRLKKQGAPGGDEPINAMLAALERALEQSLSAMTTDQVVQVCGQYSKVIEDKDLEATSIPKLLSIVKHADEVLSAREQT
jgi:hypothetical protein